MNVISVIIKDTEQRKMSLLCTVVLLALFSAPSDALTNDEISEFTARIHTESNTNLQGTVNVDTSSDAENIIITSNGIPDHETGTFPGPDNRNNIKSQKFSFRIPKSPTQAASSSCLTLGPIAISKNGVPLFNPNTLRGQNAVEGEYKETFDDCDGHPDGMGVYHYHQTPDCLYNDTNDEFIGVALDGFPIYGIKNSTGTELTSADLDSCHGHMYNGTYMYRLTRDYPYIMGCYKGTQPSGEGGRPVREDCISGGERCAIQKVPLFLMAGMIGILTQLAFKLE